MIAWPNVKTFLSQHFPLKPWDIEQMHWGEIKAYAMRGLMMERKDYQLNAPSMGGKDSQRKWRNKVVQPQMEALFDQMFPMTKNGRKEICDKQKDKVEKRKERLRKIREITNE